MRHLGGECNIFTPELAQIQPSSPHTLNMLTLLINSGRGKRVPGLCLPGCSYSNNMLLQNRVHLTETAELFCWSCNVTVVVASCFYRCSWRAKWGDNMILTEEEIKCHQSPWWICNPSFLCQLSPVFFWKPCSSECRTLCLASCGCVTWSWSRDSAPFRFWFIAGGSRNRPALSRGGRRNCDVWQVLLRRTLLYQSINTLHTDFKLHIFWISA